MSTTKTCSKCGKVLPKTAFCKRKANTDGYAGVCKGCRSYKRKRPYEHIVDGKLLCVVCKQYKEPESFDIAMHKPYREFKDNRCKECKSASYKRRRAERAVNNSLERTLHERFLGLKDRNKKFTTIVNFDLGYLIDMWATQNGKCALSNIPMTFETRKGRVPTNVSIDRIDSNVGYIKGNIQLVCMAVNQMKSDLSYQELLYFCDSILKNKHHEN